MFHYAQINADGYCFSVLTTHSRIDAPNMIEVNSDPDTYLGRRYVDGAWVN